MADRASQARAARQAAGQSRSTAAATARGARSPMYGGVRMGPREIAAYAKANPRSTPVGDALGTVAGSVMDYVSRPLYMVGDVIGGDIASLGKNAVNLVLPGTQAIEPLAGSRETASQELEKRGVNFGGGVLGFAGRLATDVALDPLTYLTFGTGAALKGGLAIGKAAEQAAMRSGAYSAQQIAKLQKHGFLNEAAAMAERTKTATQVGAQREIATRAWNAERGGPTVVAGFRIPTTAVRAINKATGANVKQVVPFAESRKAAAALEKVGLGLNAAKGAPTLRAIFSPAGGEDASAYQAMLGAMNATNQHKAMFAREGRQIEHAIEKAGKAGGIKKVDASPTVSHLADAVEIGSQGAARVAKVQERVASGRATLDDLAALADEPMDTRSAYEWLRNNHNHGARFQFPEYDDAVRIFGDPDAPEAGSIMDVVQQQSKRIEEYADAAGVMYDKLDVPYYLTHLPANKAAREALDKMAETVATKRGDIRKMQEGFTRHRALQTLKDWYEAEAKLGIKLVPELSVGRRLTVRGVSGASEAMHSTLSRELIKLYGARGPLPDMDKLDAAVRDAIEETASRQTKLDTLLNRAHSPVAEEARSEYMKLRQERIAASKALKEARAKVSKRAKSGKKQINVDQHELVIAAKKKLDDIQAQIDEIKSRPRERVAPVDLSAKRQEAIAEATRNLELAQADRNRALSDVISRVTGAANEKIRQIKDEYAKADDGEAGAFDTPELEQRAIQNETLNQARQEVARLEETVAPVAFAIATVMKRYGLLNPKTQGKMPGSFTGGGWEDSVLFMMTEQERVDAARAKLINSFETGGSKYRQKKDLPTTIEGFIPYALKAMQDKTFMADASSFIGMSARTKVGKAKKSDGTITQAMWDDAHENVDDLIAAREVVDQLESDMGVGVYADIAEKKAAEDASLDALGHDPAASPFQTVEIPPAEPTAAPKAQAVAQETQGQPSYVPTGSVFVPQRPSELAGGAIPFQLDKGDLWKIDATIDIRIKNAQSGKTFEEQSAADKAAREAITEEAAFLAEKYGIALGEILVPINLRTRTRMMGLPAFPAEGSPAELRQWVIDVASVREQAAAKVIARDKDLLKKLGNSKSEMKSGYSVSGAPNWIRKTKIEEIEAYSRDAKRERDALRLIDTLLEDFWWAYPGLVKKVPTGPITELDGQATEISRMYGWLGARTQSSSSTAPYGFILDDPKVEARLTGSGAEVGRIRVNRSRITGSWEPADISAFRGGPRDLSQYPSDAAVEEAAGWRARRAENATKRGEHWLGRTGGDEYRFQTPAPHIASTERRARETEVTPDTPAVETQAPTSPAGTNVPTGEEIPVATNAADVIPQASIEDLPWSQRQVVKLIRSRKSSKSAISVKDKGGRGFIRVGGKTVGISHDELMQMADSGWLSIQSLNKKGQITSLRPGPNLVAEGKPYSQAEDAIIGEVASTFDNFTTPELTQAEAALARASEPVTKDQKRIAELEAALATEKTNAKIQHLIDRELGNMKARKTAAREQLREAEKTARQEVIEPARKAYDDAKAAEQAAKDYADLLRTPPNARKVAAATRQRDEAMKTSQALINEQERAQLAVDAAKAWIASLYKADASYDEALLATGIIRDGDDWERVRASWVKISDRYIPKGSKNYDPNGAILFDPAVAPQIQRIYDRITPVMHSPTALRKVGRFIQGITRAWKSLVLATPGYHLRNMIDDGLRAYWAGARNPATFYQAVRILQGKPVKMKIGGKTYTADEIMSMANVHGIIGTGSQYHSEVGPAYDRQTPRKWLGGVPMPRRIGSGSIVTNSQAIGEWRENMTRLGTFLELMKNGEHEITAAKNTRDFLFDYNDTSQFINAAKDFWSPFLTYSLKAIPFYARTAVQRPGQIANLASFMRDMTETAKYDYPGQLNMSLLPPGQELAFAIPHIPGVSDWLFGAGKTGTIDPSNLIGISSLNQASPITFPQPTNGESAVGAALGTLPKGAARVFGGFGNPLAVTGVELATGQDLRYGSPRPDRVRMTPVPLAAQRLLSTVSGGNLNMPGYGMKTDQYTGQQVEGMSGNVMRLLNLFPPVNQIGSYTTAATGVTEPLIGFDNPFVTESDRGRIGFARTLFGLPIRPFDVSREQFYASRRQ